jgi:hypothetical protein
MPWRTGLYAAAVAALAAGVCPAQQPAFLGWLAAGSDRLHAARPEPAPPNGVGHVGRDRLTNALEITDGQPFNDRFRSSTLPTSKQLVVRVRFDRSVPDDRPEAHVPLATTRHLRLSAATVIPGGREVHLTFLADRLGTDLLYAGLLAADGVEGVVHFATAGECHPVRLRAVEPGSPVATLWLRTGPCGAELLLRSEIEFPIQLERITYRYARQTRTLVAPGRLRPWGTVAFGVSGDPAQVAWGDSRVAFQVIAGPPSFPAGSGQPAAPVCAPGRWSDQWRRLAAATPSQLAPAGDGAGLAVRGFDGFRFEDMGGTLAVDLDLLDPAPTAARLIPVRWAADPHGVQGVVYWPGAGRPRALLSLSRFAVRVGALERLLLADEGGRALAELPLLTTAYDLDRADCVQLPQGAAPILQVSHLAGALAAEEIARLRDDEAQGPLDPALILAEIRRLSQYLAATGDAPSPR